MQGVWVFLHTFLWEVRCVNLCGEMRGVSWVHRCRLVNKGTPGKQVHTLLPQLCTLESLDEKSRGVDEKDGDLCRLKERQVWMLRQMLECRLHLPADKTHPSAHTYTRTPNAT